MGQYEVLRVKPEDKELFLKLTAKFKRKQIDLAGQMIRFFDQSGYDPLAQSFETPSEELKKLRDTLVSFIRTQEKQYVRPMADKVDGLVLALAEFIKEHKENSVGIIEDEPVQTHKEELMGSQAPVKQASGVPKKDYQDLEIRCEKAEIKLSRIEPHFEKIKAAVRWRSTGLSKGYVLEISKEEFEEIFG